MSVSFTRLWMLRLIRYGVGLIVTLIALGALLWAYVNWSGPRHWAAVKARLESEGETLDFIKLLPPREDPGTNFCAIDALDGIALEGDEHSPQGKKRKALEELGWNKFAAQAPRLRRDWALGCSTDLAAWAKFARDTAFIQMPPDSGNAARDLLQAIDRSQTLVKVLADAAVTHPNAGFTPLLRDRPLTSPLVNLALRPCYTSAVRAQEVLGLRALAASQCGDPAAATSSVLAMLRLTEAFSQDPFFLAMLGALSCHDSAEEAIWSILEKRNASENELRELQSVLGKLTFQRVQLAAMRGEFAVGLDAITYAQEHTADLSALMHNVYAVSESPAAKDLVGDLVPSAKGLALLCKLVPSGLFDENKAVLATLEFECLIKPLKAGGYGSLIHHELEMENELRAHRGAMHPDYFMAFSCLPGMLRMTDRIYSRDAIRRQAIIACALERYYLQHKTYPAALAELVPQFISSIPSDPMDDKPMRYCQTSDGRYMIWSVGFDQKDDNGKVNPGRYRDGKLNVHDLYHRQYKGDWTWQYQPVK